MEVTQKKWKFPDRKQIIPHTNRPKYLAVHLWVLVDICCHNLNQLRAIATARNTISDTFTLSNCTLLLCWKVWTDVHLQLCLEYHDQYGEAHSYSHAIRQAEKKCGQKRHYPHTLKVENNRVHLKYGLWSNIAPTVLTYAVQFVLFP